MRFSPPDTVVTIRSCPDRDTRGGHLVSVEDWGVGMPRGRADRHQRSPRRPAGSRPLGRATPRVPRRRPARGAPPYPRDAHRHARIGADGDGRASGRPVRGPAARAELAATAAPIPHHRVPRCPGPRSSRQRSSPTPTGTGPRPRGPAGGPRPPAPPPPSMPRRRAWRCRPLGTPPRRCRHPGAPPTRSHPPRPHHLWSAPTPAFPRSAGASRRRVSLRSCRTRSTGPRPSPDDAAGSPDGTLAVPGRPAGRAQRRGDRRAVVTGAPLDWLLAEFARETPGVMQVVVVSGDGLRLATSPGMDDGPADQLSAAASGLVSLARGTAHLLHAGPVTQTILEMARATCSSPRSARAPPSRCTPTAAATSGWSATR